MNRFDDDVPSYSTAVEMKAQLQAGYARTTFMTERFRFLLLSPMIDAVTKALGGRPSPKWKRWDQYGAYHKRQMKKWSKQLTRRTGGRYVNGTQRL